MLNFPFHFLFLIVFSDEQTGDLYLVCRVFYSQMDQSTLVRIWSTCTWIFSYTSFPLDFIFVSPTPSSPKCTSTITLKPSLHPEIKSFPLWGRLGPMRRASPHDASHTSPHTHAVLLPLSHPITFSSSSPSSFHQSDLYLRVGTPSRVNHSTPASPFI